MTQPPPLPDLDSLSDAQKNELIVSLWHTIAAMQAKTDEVARHGKPASTGDLRARIGRTAPSRRGHVGTKKAGRFGVWTGLLESGVVVGILAAIGLGFAVDFGIGWYQQHAIATQRRAALELENSAFAGLNVELIDVTYDPDGKSYRLRLAMQNFHPETPLYIMLNPGRVFVQTGLVWQGVPTQAAPDTQWGVVKLDGTQNIGMVFQVNVDDWTQLLPGYMHLRIQSDMLISRSSEPKNDLIERVNRFNVYLKPRNADDAEIKRRMKFSGVPPIYISMPPH